MSGFLIQSLVIEGNGKLNSFKTIVFMFRVVRYYKPIKYTVSFKSKF